MIKVVVFDIDGVLIDSFNANYQFYQDLMTAAGYKPPTKEGYLPLFHRTMHDVIKILTKSASEEEINRIWEMGRGRMVPYPSHLLKLTDGVEETLQELNKNYTLGIVTGRVRERIYEIPALAKLKKYFQVTVAYQDTTNHKPHPEPLHFACDKLQVKPNEAVYIGDVENDVIAGKAADMKTILFAEAPVGNPDAYTFSFTELPELIKSL